MNKKLFTSFSILGVLSVFALANIANVEPLITIGSSDSNTFTLNSSLTPIVEDGRGELSVSESYSTFTYTNASLLENYHVVLAEGGTISKNEATLGLESITATFEGAIRFECGFESDYETQEVTYMANLVSGETLNVSGNYWNITALEETKITSITYTYSCDIPSEITTPTLEGLVGIQNIAQFADIVKVDDTIYLKVKCTYNSSLGRLTAEDLTVKGDSSSELYKCSFIKTTGVDTFEAYFNVSDSHSTILGSKASHIVYLHLLVKGVNYNKTSSAAGTGNISTSNNYLRPRNLSVSGNRTIEFGLRDTGTRLAWLILRKGNVVDFNTALAEDTANVNNPDNPFASVNEGSAGGSSYSTEASAHNTYRYGNVQSKVFKTTIISNMATTATVSFITGGRGTLTLSYERITDATSNAYLSDVAVNGDSTNIVGLDSTYTFPKYNNLDGWNYYKHCPLFTLPLVEGVNEITFKINNVEANNPLNFAGLSFNLDEADAKIALKRVYDVNYSNASTLPSSTSEKPNDYSVSTTYKRVGEFNPITNVEGKASYNAYNFGYESGQLWRHGEILGYTLTSEIYSSEATTATIKLIASGNTNRSFSPIKANVSSITNAAWLEEISVNGSTENIVIDDTTTTMKGWTTYFELELADVQLQKGLNVITFRLLGKNSQSKLNLRGLALEAAANITLG